ncbi:hypothetical protein N657DRAFT_325748 [Parathielavia appendiculata]|uniref:Uncharacterized protein n=1 Tax=Parathielavia appendiculata TaxID=2587402 RepID=A0AAN6YZY1_9PEZI|nr:hypothetical protein N657DRAFT_325748 [Parathielavia appendiculata]
MVKLIAAQPLRNVQLSQHPKLLASTVPSNWARQCNCETALMQATGHIPERPCKSCEAGNRPSQKSCIVSRIGSYGACANRRYGSKHLSLRFHTGKEPRAENSRTPTDSSLEPLSKRTQCRQASRSVPWPLHHRIIAPKGASPSCVTDTHKRLEGFKVYLPNYKPTGSRTTSPPPPASSPAARIKQLWSREGRFTPCRTG